ncbi:hypothetical protein [Bifidobacterium moukalabense]|uniref:hypothetical protein n=1 Tax=Bifidobacterium moukalabense TaxID=1333651 RepID=UPI001FCEFF90|nr:hypothetical protein [Bifidobacterium moukalabense]
MTDSPESDKLGDGGKGLPPFRAKRMPRTGPPDRLATRPKLWITPVLRPQPLILRRTSLKIPYLVRMNMHKHPLARVTKAQRRLDAMLHQAHARRRLAVPDQPRDRRAFQRRMRTGVIIMPKKGCYISAQQWNALSYANRIIWTLRTVCHQHPDWVLCGPSAAGAYGYSTTLQLQRYVHIAVTERSKAGRHGFVIAHFYKDPPPTKVVDGMRVTGEIQTMADCARMLDFEHAMIVCCTGLRKGNLTKEKLQEFVDNKRKIGGIIRARYVAERVEPACENGGEVAAFAAMLELGFAQPQVQVTYVSPLDERDIRPDFSWKRDDGSIVVGELDGRQKYVDPSMTVDGDTIGVILREKDRESELNMLKIDVVRFQMEHVRAREPLRQRLDAARVPRNPFACVSPFAGFRSTAY